MNTSALRGTIFSKYKSVNEFSKAIGWQRGKGARIINGNQEPNLEEIINIVSLLDISIGEFLNIFFDEKFTKWTNEAS